MCIHFADFHHFALSVCLGISISGTESPLTLGSSALLNCSSDLDIPFMTEWLYNGVPVAQNIAADALLAISVINESLHNMQYTCRVTTSAGVLERNTTVTVTSK